MLKNRFLAIFATRNATLGPKVRADERAILPHIERLSWVVSTANDPRLGASTDRFTTLGDISTTLRDNLTTLGDTFTTRRKVDLRPIACDFLTIGNRVG